MKKIIFSNKIHLSTFIFFWQSLEKSIITALILIFTLKNMKNLGLLKKGFTLIELLVVITIIGILATGATTTYTSQIQKARDSTRVSDIKAIQWGIEQYYQDISTYPTIASFRTQVQTYSQLAEDPKKWQTATGSALDYLYVVWPDSNWVSEQDYEISTVFEQSGNTTSKSSADGGGDPKRYELWIDLVTNVTATTAAITTFTATTPCIAPGAATTAACSVANYIHVIRR